jgi:hypothetical protein
VSRLQIQGFIRGTELEPEEAGGEKAADGKRVSGLSRG